jgi:hypothetical protein
MLKDSESQRAFLESCQGNVRYDPSDRVAVYTMALPALLQLESDPQKRLQHNRVRRHLNQFSNARASRTWNRGMSRREGDETHGG